VKRTTGFEPATFGLGTRRGVWGGVVLSPDFQGKYGSRVAPVRAG
jgi:hypothetical protein